MKGRAIWESYRQTGALEVECPTCGAPPRPDAWCTKTDGRVSRVPHVARCVAASKTTPDGRRSLQLASTGETSIDFSEPRHPTEMP